MTGVQLGGFRLPRTRPDARADEKVPQWTREDEARLAERVRRAQRG